MQGVLDCYYLPEPLYEAHEILSKVRNNKILQESKTRELSTVLEEAFGKKDRKLDMYYVKEIYEYYNDFKKIMLSILSEVAKQKDGEIKLKDNGFGFKVKDLDVLITQYKKGNALAQYDSQKDIIIIRCLQHENLLTIKDMLLLLEDGLRAAFVHEMTHRFDVLATKGNGKSLKIPKSRKPKDYNNNEYEYNAFLTSLIDYIENQLKQKNKNHELDYNGDIQKQVEDFVDAILNEIKQFNPKDDRDIIIFTEFYKDMDQNHKNRLVHDIYNYFTDDFYWKNTLHKNARF